MKLFFILLSVFFVSNTLLAENDESMLHKFLSQVQSRSLGIKQLEDNRRAAFFSEDEKLEDFQAKGFLSGNYVNETVSSILFEPYERKVFEYSLGLERLWESGIRTSFSYTLQDNFIKIPSRSNPDSITPRIQLSVKSNLLQDFFADKYTYLKQKVNAGKEYHSMNGRFNQKILLIKSLLDFSRILEQKEELDFQISVCGKTRVQAKKLSKRRKIYSVSKREYLLSLRDLQQCEAFIEKISGGYIEKTEAFESTYNISISSFKGLDTNSLLEQLKKHYEKIRVEKSEVNLDVGRGDDVILLELQQKRLEERQKELNAKNKPDLELELRVGSTSLSSGNSYGKAFNLDSPFASFGLQIGFPFENRGDVSRLKSNYYHLRAVGYEKNLRIKQNIQKFETLKQVLEKEFIVYEKYKKSLSLSRSIFREATRDFSNGRIELFNLADFNKRVIEDQKVLSNHRIQLIKKMVELLNYYRFFAVFFLDVE